VCGGAGLVGAAGAERLRDCATLTAIVKKQAAAKLPYAAMCASPAVVLSAQGLLDGVAATAHPAFSDQVRPQCLYAPHSRRRWRTAQTAAAGSVFC
jgi:putative intracellular protease/amidase